MCVSRPIMMLWTWPTKLELSKSLYVVLSLCTIPDLSDVAIMTLLSIDRSDLIKTIEDDEDVVADDASSDEDDVAQPKKNKAARKAKKDFESGGIEGHFVFLFVSFNFYFRLFFRLKPEGVHEGHLERCGQICEKESKNQPRRQNCQSSKRKKGNDD